MKAKSIIIFCVVSGVMFSILFWRHAVKLSDFRFYCIALILIGYISYNETIAKKRRMLNWETIRSKGRIHFILFDFVFIRGGIISILITMVLSIKVMITLIIICSLLPLLGVMAFAGNEIWKQCEETYSLAKLNSIAEKIKILQN
jgi:hypothetical protein